MIQVPRVRISLGPISPNRLTKDEYHDWTERIFRLRGDLAAELEAQACAHVMFRFRGGRAWITLRNCEEYDIPLRTRVQAFLEQSCPSVPVGIEVTYRKSMT